MNNTLIKRALFGLRKNIIPWVNKGHVHTSFEYMEMAA